MEGEPPLAEALSLQLKKNGYKISGIATNFADAVHILKTRLPFLPSSISLEMFRKTT